MRDSRMQAWSVPWWNNGCLVIIWQYLAVIGWGCVWSEEFHKIIPKPNPIAVLLFIQNNCIMLKQFLHVRLYWCLDHDFVCSSANSEYKLIKGCLIGLADILPFFANNHTLLYFPALPTQSEPTQPCPQGFLVPVPFSDDSLYFWHHFTGYHNCLLNLAMVAHY